MAEPFSHIRARIEEIDRRILQLLKSRMVVVDEIAELKLERAVPLRDQPREERVLSRVRALAVEEGIDPHAVEQLYRAIMEMSISRQQSYLDSRDNAPLRVSYQGVEGSYSHLTSQRRYRDRPSGPLLIGCATFREAAEKLRLGEVDLSLLPIENTTAGSINETYDLLAEGGMFIVGEEVSEIRHCLLGLEGATVESLRRVRSHPQALRQCSRFFDDHPWIESVPEFDTAGAARKIKEEADPSSAAIAGTHVGEQVGLSVLATGIQNQSGNFTRFVELAREARSTEDGPQFKTSLLLRLHHQVGQLGHVVEEFAKRGLNLTKLESRTSPGPISSMSMFLPTHKPSRWWPRSIRFDRVGWKYASWVPIPSLPKRGLPSKKRPFIAAEIPADRSAVCHSCSTSPSPMATSTGPFLPPLLQPGLTFPKPCFKRLGSGRFGCRLASSCPNVAYPSTNR